MPRNVLSLLFWFCSVAFGPNLVVLEGFHMVNRVWENLIPEHIDSGSMSKESCVRDNKVWGMGHLIYFPETLIIFRKEIKKKTGTWESRQDNISLEIGKHVNVC